MDETLRVSLKPWTRIILEKLPAPREMSSLS